MRKRVKEYARENYEDARRIALEALESLNGDYVTPNAIYRYSPEQTEFYRQEYTQKLRAAERALSLCQ